MARSPLDADLKICVSRQMKREIVSIAHRRTISEASVVREALIAYLADWRIIQRTKGRRA